MKETNANIIAKSLQEYRNFISDKNTEVLVYTLPFKKEGNANGE